MQKGCLLLLFLTVNISLMAQEACDREGRSCETRAVRRERFSERNYYWLRYPYCFQEWDMQQNNGWPAKRETQLWDYLTSG